MPKQGSDTILTVRCLRDTLDVKKGKEYKAVLGQMNGLGVFDETGECYLYSLRDFEIIDEQPRQKKDEDK